MTRAAAIFLVVLSVFVTARSMAHAQGMEKNQEVIPEGRWMFQAGWAAHTQREGIGRTGKTASLLELLVLDSADSAQIEGAVQREYRRLDLLFRIGFSDDWNVTLEMPYVWIEQKSSLSKASGGADVDQQIERLSSRSISGPGSLRISSLHRVFFRDVEALSWGYGFSLPLGSPESPYAGRGTLFLDNPFRAFFTFVQYDRFFLSVPGKLEFSGEFKGALDETFQDLDGNSVTIHPGNKMVFWMKWEQDFGPVFTSLGWRMLQQRASSIGPERQNDKTRENAFGFKLGLGNLPKLEKGPLAFPYLIYFQYEKTINGFNVPVRSEAGIFLKAYF